MLMLAGAGSAGMDEVGCGCCGGSCSPGGKLIVSSSLLSGARWLLVVDLGCDVVIVTITGGIQIVIMSLLSSSYGGLHYCSLCMIISTVRNIQLQTKKVIKFDISVTIFF